LFKRQTAKFYSVISELDKVMLQ